MVPAAAVPDGAAVGNLTQAVANKLIARQPYAGFTLEELLTTVPCGQAFVLKGRRSGGGEKVAAKVFLRDDGSEFDQETSIRAHVGTHKNIMPLLASFGDIPDIPRVLMMPLAESGELLDVVHNWSARSGGSTAVLVQYAKGVAEGLAHLHARGVVHLDMKSENVLVSRNVPLLTDFGLARRFGREGRDALLLYHGTTPFMAPEILADVSAGAVTGDAAKVDVYAFGMLLFEMLHGIFPWQNAFPRGAAFDPEAWSGQVYAAVRRGERPPIDDRYKANALARIIQDCWQQGPSARPTMAAVAARLV
jgi:serine/threonine protein kinase